jgi:tRNA dimethylallyltransferase
MQTLPPVVALIGPTAVGKTAVSIEVAQRLDAEIVSCDSMQVYRGMPVLSQAPSQEQLAQARHHLVACANPTENFSAGKYRALAREAIQDILSRGKTALIVGGTGLYLKALSAGMCEAPPANHDVRKRLLSECQELGSGVLYARLSSIDERAAAKIHPNDAKRIIRAIEVFVVSGRSISDWWGDASAAAQPLNMPVIGLARERQDLCERIAHRQLEMIYEQDVVGEARQLLQTPLSLTARAIHGLPDIQRYLERQITLKQLIETWKTRVRQYSKRQMTWFRHMEDVRWVQVPADEPAGTTAASVLEAIEKIAGEPVAAQAWSH